MRYPSCFTFYAALLPSCSYHVFGSKPAGMQAYHLHDNILLWFDQDFGGVCAAFSVVLIDLYMQSHQI